MTIVGGNQSTDKKKLMGVQLDLDLWETFGELAKKHNSDRSKLTRIFITEFVNKHKVKSTWKPAVKLRKKQR